MFWKRTTGHGAFWGLVAGTLAATITHGLTIAEGKGGWISPMFEIKSGMGQAFVVATFSWLTNFTSTILISLVTKPKSDIELKGLVYSLTEKVNASEQKWYLKAGPIGIILLIITIILNILLF